MPVYDFDTLVSRRNTNSFKWDKVPADAMPLTTADSDYPALPDLVEALAQRVAQANFGYTFASEGYYANIIKWNAKRHQFPIKKEELLTVPGVVCATAFVVYALTNPGDSVLLCTPVYDPFFNVTREQDRTLLCSSLIRDEAGRYRMDWEDLEVKMQQAKLFILSNPHNPVGRVWSKEELKQLGELCLKYNVPIFSDDIHADLIMPGNTYTPICNISDAIANNVVLAMAPSKTFNIAGLKSSYLVARNETLRKKVDLALKSFHVGVNLFGLLAADVAYEKGEEWVEQQNRYLFENAKFVLDFVNEKMPKVKTYIPEGTYLMWLDFSAYGLSQEELVRISEQEAKVCLNDGSHYGEEGNGFLRINLAAPRSMVSQAMEQLQAAFARY